MSDDELQPGAADAERSRPRRPAPERQRQNTSMAVAAVLGITVVVVVLLVTLRSGGGGGDEVVPDRGNAELAQVVGAEGTIPAGDYTAFCTATFEQAADFDPESGLAGFRTLLREIDLDALIAVAPEGLRPALTTVKEQREAVVATLEQVDDPSQLAAADFPAGFLDAATLISRASAEECTES